MLFPSTFIPAALLFLGAAVVTARPAADVSSTAAEDSNYAINAILRYRHKEKKDVDHIITPAVE